MPKISYRTVSFRGDSLKIIETANAIIEEYAGKGFDLTLRQLYYQFVARGELANTEKNYKRLGGIISDARLAGLLDWNSICDRTRHSRIGAHWDSPGSIVDACAAQFAIDKWVDQDVRVEAWIEKDALVDVLAGVCQRWDVPHLSCRGYVSQSELWRDARRHLAWNDQHQRVIVLHLGDHDPSGIDMSRDLQDRLQMFGADTEVRRIALTMPQVEEIKPPPNPAKVTDSRFASYEREYGDESWELDALPPDYISRLVEQQIEDIVDIEKYNAKVKEQEDGRRRLRKVAREMERE